MRGVSASLDWFGVCEGCGRLGIQPRAAPSATLSSMFWCLQWKCWRNIRWADTFCGQWLFPWSFFFSCIPCSGVESDAGGLQLCHREAVESLPWLPVLRAGACRWNQTAKWPGDNFVTYLADMLCMANPIPRPLFQSWPVLYWQADHFLSKPVTSLLSLWV